MSDPYETVAILARDALWAYGNESSQETCLGHSRGALSPKVFTALRDVLDECARYRVHADESSMKLIKRLEQIIAERLSGERIR